MMFHYSAIRKLHLEITTRCNASCPQCSRNLSGDAVKSWLPLTELSLADIKSIFPASFVRQLDKMYMCGGYGDPMVAKDTLAAFKYFRTINPEIRLTMYTNGSGRKQSWWEDLAATGVLCVFGIDGLEDTNAIYRRGTNWSSIMYSTESFIRAGGVAEWDYLVFRHNEHQVEKAESLSKAMGFTEFRAKKSNRFQFREGIWQPHVVKDVNGEQLYQLEVANSEKFQNDAVKALSLQTNPDQFHQETSICCKASKRLSVYVSAEGLVFPCCWLAGLYDGSAPRTFEFWDFLDVHGGLKQIDGRRHTLQTIIESDLFQRIIPDSWNTNSPDRLRTCSRVCGECDIKSAQYV